MSLMPRNDVELAERVALQAGAPADDHEYWEAVAAAGPFPAPTEPRVADVVELEDWRDR
jgi:hypothetical protein